MHLLSACSTVSSLSSAVDTEKSSFATWLAITHRKLRDLM